MSATSVVLLVTHLPVFLAVDAAHGDGLRLERPRDVLEVRHEARAVSAPGRVEHEEPGLGGAEDAVLEHVRRHVLHVAREAALHPGLQAGRVPVVLLVALEAAVAGAPEGVHPVVERWSHSSSPCHWSLT